MLGVGVDGPTHGASPDPGPRERDLARVAERDAWAVLAAVDGLGPVGFGALLQSFGSGRAILAVAVEPGGVARIAAVTVDPRRTGDEPRIAVEPEVAKAIADAAMEAERTLERIRGLGLAVVTVDDDTYPSRLGSIEFPPHLLFVLGDIGALEPEHAVAIVGTRHATTVGRGLAARTARALVECGVTVVSGLAVGIDGAAHAATLDAKGRTVAVLGGGHAKLYPRSHQRLADDIVATGGAVVSERAPDVPPTRWSFPRRNRVISGLTDASVVIEAPAKSGALVTASWALEQGRGCYLVPGAIDDPAQAGCLSFLRDWPGQARVMTGIPQLIEDLGLALKPKGRRATVLAGATLPTLGRAAAAVAEALIAGHATVDELAAVTGLPIATLLATLTLLERDGLAVGVFGRYRPAGTLAFQERRPGPRLLPAANE